MQVMHVHTLRPVFDRYNMYQWFEVFLAITWYCFIQTTDDVSGGNIYVFFILWVCVYEKVLLICVPLTLDISNILDTYTPVAQTAVI